MKKLLGIILFGTIISAYAIPYNEIDFKFYPQKGIGDITFEYESSDASAGKYHANYFSVNKIDQSKDSSLKRKLEFAAERHKSTGIADEFLLLSGGSKHMVATDLPVDDRPSRLNFVIMTKMTINGSYILGQYLYLAQGHSGGGVNNWWIGTPNAARKRSKASDNNLLIVTTTDGNQYSIQGIVGLSHEFAVRPYPN